MFAESLVKLQELLFRQNFSEVQQRIYCLGGGHIHDSDQLASQPLNFVPVGILSVNRLGQRLLECERLLMGGGEFGSRPLDDQAGLLPLFIRAIYRVEDVVGEELEMLDHSFFVEGHSGVPMAERHPVMKAPEVGHRVGYGDHQERAQDEEHREG